MLKPLPCFAHTVRTWVKSEKRNGRSGVGQDTSSQSKRKPFTKSRSNLVIGFSTTKSQTWLRNSEPHKLSESKWNNAITCFCKNTCSVVSPSHAWKHNSRNTLHLWTGSVPR